MLSMDSSNLQHSNAAEVPKSRLGFCEVCAHQQAKYTCPRCDLKTCSLDCSKLHKLELECSGIRDRTKFIPINQFTNFDLASDYRLLEEISRVVETSKKRRPFIHFRLDRFSFRLQKEALNRKIQLKFLPKNFARHKNNTTRFYRETEVINWRIEWIFVNSDMKLADERIPETTRISSVLQKYFEKQTDPVLQEQLQFYQAAEISGIKVLLKAEAKSGRKFYEVDVTSTIRECLRNKVIIEYPTFHVILRDHASVYDVIDTDDEGDEKGVSKQIQNGEAVINKIIKTSENDGTLYGSFKNFLFATEYSEDEDNF